MSEIILCSSSVSGSCTFLSGNPYSIRDLLGDLPVVAIFLKIWDAGTAISYQNSLASLTGRSPANPPLVLFACLIFSITICLEM